MAKGYQLIKAEILTSTAASVTFSNIPQNFTDLQVLCSLRSNRSDSSAVVDQYYIRLNGNNNSNSRVLRGNSSTGSSSDGQGGIAPTSLATANTFSNDSIYIPNYTSGNNKSVLVDSVMENNAPESWLWLFAGLYGTAAVTSITFAPNAGTAFTSGSEFYLYGVGGARATGGTITVDSNYTYHTFTSTGSFIPSEKIKKAEILVIGGGGAGGTNFGGGGGAGGVIHHNNFLFTAGTTYTAVVGAGATAYVSYAANDGNASSFAGLIGNAGGGGGGSDNGTNAGRSGGSGGGGNRTFSGGAATQVSMNGGFGYGNAGGGSSNSFQAGGGGGSGAAGLNGIGTTDGTSKGGAGGDGLEIWSSWARATSTGVNGFYAGGGGGAGRTTNSTGGGAGGTGGGGSGGKGTANGGVAGTANTGSGGGGGTDDIGGTGNGGSGLIIVRYPNN
jgi:hypothetical protein